MMRVIIKVHNPTKEGKWKESRDEGRFRGSLPCDGGKWVGSYDEGRYRGPLPQEGG